MQEQEEQQKAVMAEFHKPPDRTPEQLLQLVMQLVSRAAERGQSEVQVYRFPNTMCTDRGRRINNSEAGWETDLGRPPQGRLRILARVICSRLALGLRRRWSSTPGGMPGDIGFFLTWK